MDTTWSSARQAARPTGVRGSRAPIEYGGNPGAPTGNTWGTSVAHGTPARSAASAGASVRMSATTTSGASAAISGSVSRVARTTAS